MSSSLSLCPLWALWVQETRFWRSWQSSDFATFRNPAKITEQVRVTKTQMQMSPVPGSQAHGFRFPLCSGSLGYLLLTLLRSLISWFHVSLTWLYRFPVLPWRLSCNKSACSAGDMGSIPESGRSPGEGNGNPLHYSCPGNPWTEEPGALQSMGSQRVTHNWEMKAPPQYYQSHLYFIVANFEKYW